MTDDQFTPREDFEAVFGPTTDRQWQWLKEFMERNYVPRHGPSEFMERYFEDVRRRYEEADEEPLPLNFRLDGHVFKNVKPYELSLDTESNAFGESIHVVSENEEGD